MFEVEGGCGSAEAQCGDVLLGVGLQLVDALGGTSCADNHHACSQRVKRARVPHLQFLRTEAFAQEPTHFVDHVERGPAIGLVDIEYFASLKVH